MQCSIIYSNIPERQIALTSKLKTMD